MAKDVDSVGVVLLNLGGPRDTSDIEPFLVNLLSDPQVVGLPWPLRPWLAKRIARRRAPLVAKHYQAIGGASPIDEQSRSQAQELGRRLGPGFLVDYAFRHAEPFAADAIRSLVSAGVRKVVALPAYPQWSQSTSGSAIEDFRRQAARHAVEMDWVKSYPEAPGYIQALLDAALPSLQNCSYVMITAHGLPQRLIEKGDPYVKEVQKTADAFVRRLPAGTRHSVAFQSRMGPAAWTQPYLTDEIVRLGQSGVKDLVLVPISFVCENLETLYELDIQVAQLAGQCGIERFVRVPTPGLSVSFIDALAELVLETAHQAGWRSEK